MIGNLFYLLAIWPVSLSADFIGIDINTAFFVKLIIILLSIIIALCGYIIGQFIDIRARNYELTIEAEVDSIVVLGAGLRSDGRPSAVLSDRLMRAANLYQQGIANKIICTGGVGIYPPSEAEASRRFLLTLGIPSEDILLEDQSYSTRDQGALVWMIYQQYHWQSIALTTSFYHAKRARQIFRRHGFDQIFDTSCRHPAYDKLNYWMLRESLALAVMNWWRWSFIGLSVGIILGWLVGWRMN